MLEQTVEEEACKRNSIYSCNKNGINYLEWNDYIDAYDTRLTKKYKFRNSNILQIWLLYLYIKEHNILKTRKCPGYYELKQAQFISRPH